MSVHHPLPHPAVEAGVVAEVQSGVAGKLGGGGTAVAHLEGREHFTKIMYR